MWNRFIPGAANLSSVIFNEQADKFLPRLVRHRAWHVTPETLSCSRPPVSNCRPLYARASGGCARERSRSKKFHSPRGTRTRERAGSCTTGDDTRRSTQRRDARVRANTSRNHPSNPDQKVRTHLPDGRRAFFSPVAVRDGEFLAHSSPARTRSICVSSSSYHAAGHICPNFLLLFARSRPIALSPGPPDNETRRNCFCDRHKISEKVFPWN